MAFNVRSGGKAESVPVPNTVKSGDLVRVGQLVGIAEIDAFLGGDDTTYFTTVALEGIAHAPLTAAVTAGAPLYVTGAGPGTVTLTATSASGAKPVGYAVRSKTSGAGEVWFKLIPTTVVVA